MASLHEQQIAELRAIMLEIAREHKARLDETERVHRKYVAEQEAMQKKRDAEEAKRREEEEKEAKIKAAEEEKIKAEEAKRQKKLDALLQKTLDGIADLRIQTGGIAASNGLFSETYFYNSLENSLRFAGVDFDEIEKPVTKTRKLPDGQKIRGEYDIVMYSADSVAIIEIKYKATKGDTEDLINRKLENFKKIFPQYANHAFYLGLAGMSFDEGAEEEAKKYGIGILKPKGENVKIIDKHVRAY